MPEAIIIEGGAKLHGELPVSGSKNAVLPLMVASLLTDETLTLNNAPNLADTRTLAHVLKQLGATVDIKPDKISITAETITNTTAPYELVAQMRASFWVLGPLLARCHAARVSLPGGCAIGTRPVDLYLQALAQMGADLDIQDGYVIAKTNTRLKAARINLPFISVGVTHVLMMSACLADGTTIINNVATEPEITELGTCLINMGAKIEGLGTRCLTIHGDDRLHTTEHNVSKDRIEAGAFAIAAIATRGKIHLKGANLNLLGITAKCLTTAGATLTETQTGLTVEASTRPLPTSITTGAYPEFATDLQAPFMALMCLADGTSHIRETIFENRFMQVQELSRLGANIRLMGDTAIVNGVETLKGAPVMANDLRGSMSLVIAALAANGTSTINRVYHLDRGFETLETKLSKCGANIRRETIKP